MTDRPILFSAPMVRALLDGSKTQTRRIWKLPKGHRWDQTQGGMASGQIECDRWPGTWDVAEYRSPYGREGDQLWVRETFFCNDSSYPNGVGVNCHWREVDGTRVPIPIEEQRAGMLEQMYYRADGETEIYGADGPIPWRPSIHMPRWASRITLEVTSVHVERLQDITEADALAEGVESIRGERKWFRSYLPSAMGSHVEDYTALTAVESYRTLWQSINATGSWEANPWVWVIQFKVVKP